MSKSTVKMKISKNDIFKVISTLTSIFLNNTHNSLSIHPFTLQSSTHLKRAPTEKLRQVFAKYATQYKDGEYYMTTDDFVRVFLGLFPEPGFNEVGDWRF